MSRSEVNNNVGINYNTLNLLDTNVEFITVDVVNISNCTLAILQHLTFWQIFTFMILTFQYTKIFSVGST